MSESSSFVEGVQIKLEPAPIMYRVTAAMIDGGIISAALTVLLVPLSIFIGIFAVGLSVTGIIERIKEGSIFWIVLAFVILLVLLLALMGALHFYYIYTEYKYGATPGKRLMGLRVVSVDGKRLSKGQAVYRDLVRWYLDGLLILPAIISIACTEKRQRVGDILAGTMVVHSKASSDNVRYLYVKREDYLALYAHLQPGPIDEPTRESYLAFATQFYIMGRAAERSAEREAWVPRARALLARSDELRLNDETVLRFFAELCFQRGLEIKEQENKK